MFILKEPKYVIRRITQSDKSRNIYLTFDDGPCENTLNVLKILDEYKVKASFFVIGQKAEKQINLIKSLIEKKHSVFSHSIDHNYLNYFKSSKHVESWIKDSIEHIHKITKVKTNCFRPPAGIITPPLLKAAHHLNVPLILWTHRFYDTQYLLTEKKIDQVILKIQPGDIILLHDFQKIKNQTQFLNSLRYLVMTLKKNNFHLASLQNSDIQSTIV